MELHAIILCGEGKALSPFSRVRLTGMPKALLPIANRPMIEYVLEWCEQAYFPRLTLIADDATSDEIQNAIDVYKNSRAKKVVEDEQANAEVFDYSPSIELLSFNNEHSGELISFLQKSNHINQDFVILPCDFITNLPPQVVIEAYRNREKSDIGLLVAYKNQLEIEDKKSRIFPKNYTIHSEISDLNSYLLDMYSPADINFHEALKIRTQLAWRYPKSTISTKLLYSSIFFGTRRIFEVFKEDPETFSDAYFKSRPLIKVIRDLARGAWKSSSSKETIGLFTVPHQAVFFRSNNLPVFMEANRYFMKLQAIEKSQQGSNSTKEKAGANVGADSLVGEGTTLLERTNVKRTVIGSNCNIGKRVKLTGCLIFNNVTIGDDVQLENCIIGTSAKIHDKARLVNTNVESTHEVPTGTHGKGETLLCLSLEGLAPDDKIVEDPLSESSEDESDDETTEDDFEDEYTGNEDGLFAY